MREYLDQGALVAPHAELASHNKTMNLKPLLVTTVAFVSSVLTLSTVHPAIAQNAVLTARDPASQINIRSAPSSQSVAPSHGLVGDRVAVLSQTQGSDGYTWYQVRFERSQVEGWVRGDFITLLNLSTPTPSSSPLPLATQPDRPNERYSQEQVNYFLEVALGGEFGDASAAIRKWQGDVRIQYFGSPTSPDLATLETVVAEINRLTHNSIRLQLVDANPDIEIYFVPESSFSRYESNYRPRNLGFFWTWWNGDNILDRARVLISTDGVTQQERSHLLREELTQSLGLMQDSYTYGSSIFYQGWTDVIQYTELDRVVISMLYRPELQAGMTRSQVVATLNTLSTAQQASQTAPNKTRPTPVKFYDPAPLDFSLPAIDR